MTTLTISLEPDASPMDREAIAAGLRAYNRRQVADPGWAPLALFLRDPDHHIQGGLLGESGWGWLHIYFLWVAEPFQRSGYGGALLVRAESEARRRGCRGIHLDSHDFQAPVFYQRRGYEIFGTLEDYPRGHRRYFLRKTLEVAPAQAD
jgi:GNAT superfamily N-acetyltransferase